MSEQTFRVSLQQLDNRNRNILYMYYMYMKSQVVRICYLTLIWTIWQDFFIGRKSRFPEKCDGISLHSKSSGQKCEKSCHFQYSQIASIGLSQNQDHFFTLPRGQATFERVKIGPVNMTLRGMCNLHDLKGLPIKKSCHMWWAHFILSGYEADLATGGTMTRHFYVEPDKTV